jgi:hypothetical protein
MQNRPMPWIRLALVTNFGALLAACSAQVATPDEVVAARQTLQAAASSPTAASAPNAVGGGSSTAPAALTPAEVNARRDAAGSLDGQSAATKQRYYQAWREAAERAVALQKAAIATLVETRRNSVGDSTTLAQIDQQLASMRQSMQDMDTKRQAFASGTAPAQ